MAKSKQILTHSEAYHLVCLLPKYLREKLPNPEGLLFVKPRTFYTFITKVISLGGCHKDILFHSICACETLIVEKEMRDESYDMQKLVRGVVNPRLSTSPIEEKRAMRSLVYSLFGMRSQIKQGLEDARVVIVK